MITTCVIRHGKTVTELFRKKIYTVSIKEGVQSFRLDYQGTFGECQWLEKMFRKALKKHNRDVIKRWKKRNAWG